MMWASALMLHGIILSTILDSASVRMGYVVMRKVPLRWHERAAAVTAGMVLKRKERREGFPRNRRHSLPEKTGEVMNGSKYRFRDHSEFFRSASRIQPGRRHARETMPPHQTDAHDPGGEDAPRRHCTAGEVAQELGYSVSYILAVKKAMYPQEASRPRRLDPAHVSHWICEHPSFRMKEMYRHHPKDEGQQLLEF